MQLTHDSPAVQIVYPRMKVKPNKFYNNYELVSKSLPWEMSSELDFTVSAYLLSSMKAYSFFNKNHPLSNSCQRINPVKRRLSDKVVYLAIETIKNTGFHRNEGL